MLLDTINCKSYNLDLCYYCELSKISDDTIYAECRILYFYNNIIDNIFGCRKNEIIHWIKLNKNYLHQHQHFIIAAKLAHPDLSNIIDKIQLLS